MSRTDRSAIRYEAIVSPKIRSLEIWLALRARVGDHSNSA